MEGEHIIGSIRQSYRPLHPRYEIPFQFPRMVTRSSASTLILLENGFSTAVSLSIEGSPQTGLFAEFFADVLVHLATGMAITFNVRSNDIPDQERLQALKSCGMSA